MATGQHWVDPDGEVEVGEVEEEEETQPSLFIFRARGSGSGHSSGAAAEGVEKKPRRHREGDSRVVICKRGRVVILLHRPFSSVAAAEPRLPKSQELTELYKFQGSRSFVRPVL